MTRETPAAAHDPGAQERASRAARLPGGPVPDHTIRAAGGVLCREGPDGTEVCLIHRPRYDDWSLPKGKLHRGEHPLAGAVREVVEETGVLGVPQVRLPTIGYRMPDGTPKTVDYWLMRTAGGPGFTPNDEVDTVRWVPLAQAAGQLTKDHDAGLVWRAAELPAVTAVVVLLRHGYACERETWSGPDAARPLNDRGRDQARVLAGLLPVFLPDRLVSAGPDRCRQTLEPLATGLGLPIEIDAAFDETASTSAALRRLCELPGSAPASVISSQGRLIPRVMAELSGEPPEGYATRKGDGWLLAFAGTRLAAFDRLSLSENGLPAGDQPQDDKPQDGRFGDDKPQDGRFRDDEPGTALP